MSNQGKPDIPIDKVVAIVFVDIVEYSSYEAHLGDLYAKSLNVQFSERARRSISVHNGRIGKHFGDGFLAIFDQTVDAVKFAIEFQQSLRDNPIPADGHNQKARIAVHSDTVRIRNTVYGLDAFGTGLSFAARLQSHCPPGGIILSDHAYQELRSDSAAPFSVHQEQVILKGFGVETAWLLAPTWEGAR